jgi:uncharacterized secreted repeat protein (TIGR03808 family)
MPGQFDRRAFFFEPARGLLQTAERSKSMKRREFLSHFGTYVAITALPSDVAAQARPFADSPLRGTGNATNYGVIAGAAVDQSTQFQAMLDAAAAEKTALFLPAGQYFLSGIRLPSGIVIEGIPGQTQLVHTGSGAFLTANQASAIAFHGIALQGSPKADAESAEGLVDFMNVQNFVFEDCSFRGAVNCAIRLQGSSGRVSGSAIADVREAGIYATDSTGLSVIENAIDGCGNGGVVIYRSSPGHDGTVVRGNRIRNTDATNGGTGQWGNAINFFRADNTVAADNVISDSAFTAIRGNSVRNMRVTGNRCTNSGETAIYAEFAYENAVIADNTVDGAANGISAPNLDHGGHGAIITGNVVRNLRTTAPYKVDFPAFGTGIGVEADAVVTGNLVENAPLYGINAGWGPYLRNVDVAENTIRNALIGIGVSAVDGAGRATIRNNMIGAHETGILAHAWGKPVGPDLLVNPDDAPANVTLAGNRAVSG